jgi:hypothetical protein
MEELFDLIVEAGEIRGRHLGPRLLVAPSTGNEVVLLLVRDAEGERGRVGRLVTLRLLLPAASGGELGLARAAAVIFVVVEAERERGWVGRLVGAGLLLLAAWGGELGLARAAAAVIFVFVEAERERGSVRRLISPRHPLRAASSRQPRLVVVVVAVGHEIDTEREGRRVGRRVPPRLASGGVGGRRRVVEVEAEGEGWGREVHGNGGAERERGERRGRRGGGDGAGDAS